MAVTERPGVVERFLGVGNVVEVWDVARVGNEGEAIVADRTETMKEVVVAVNAMHQNWMNS